VINLLIGVMNVAISWQMLSMPFLAPKPAQQPFWCSQGTGGEKAKDLIMQDGRDPRCFIPTSEDEMQGKLFSRLI